MNAEKPILFSDAMVRAILEGRKDVTRRIVKPQPHRSATTVLAATDGSGDVRFFSGPFSGSIGVARSEWTRPRWHPGDLLYVREAWGVGPGCLDSEGPTLYRATVETPPGWPSHRGPFSEMVRWRPSIHMHKARARLWLRVVSVRAERLQDMTDAEAAREGVSCLDAFVSLWDMINGAGSWARNEWIWRVEFRREARS